MIRPAGWVVVLCLFLVQFAIAQESVRYTIALSDPSHHLVHVTMEIPPGRDAHVLQLPVWNALYQIRDFSQYIDWIRAEDPGGERPTLTELNPSRWSLRGAVNGARIEYQILADNPDPYGAQLNPHHAFFNLAEILLYAEDQRNAPVEVQIRDLPDEWKIATSLTTKAGVFTAANYDQLVDSPVEMGTFAEREFSQPCANYRVVLDDTSAGSLRSSESMLKKIIPPMQKIVSTETAWMNDCPYRNFLFLYHASDATGGGGMEHAYSTAITLPVKDFTDELGDFNSVTAHEFFHLWNVKRIRPQSLQPVDYTKENYTRALWFSEGVDSTVAEYILLRAGLLDERLYLNHLSQEITELEDRPAHLTQSAEQSSLDAWLEKYPSYLLPQRSVSYYNKGELLGVLLDLSMREATGDHESLRDLFRWMNDHYAKKGKFFADSDGIREAAEAVSHANLEDFFRGYVQGVAEIPWDRFFARVGLRVISIEMAIADPGFETTKNFDQPPVVAKVESGGAAQQAGIREGDTIVAVNGEPAGRSLEQQLENLAPGSRLRLVVERDGVRHEVEWPVQSRKLKIFQLQDVPRINAEQKARRELWLFGHARTRQ